MTVKKRKQMARQATEKRRPRAASGGVLEFAPARTPRSPKFTTVGVRLVHIPNPTRVFTYKVLAPHEFKPGDTVVVDAAGGMLVGIIVRVDARPNLDGPYTYKWLRHRVVELHGADVSAEPIDAEGD
jgi:hypothetical protein